MWCSRDADSIPFVIFFIFNKSYSMLLQKEKVPGEPNFYCLGVEAKWRSSILYAFYKSCKGVWAPASVWSQEGYGNNLGMRAILPHAHSLFLQ